MMHFCYSISFHRIFAIITTIKQLVDYWQLGYPYYYCLKAFVEYSQSTGECSAVKLIQSCRLVCHLREFCKIHSQETNCFSNKWLTGLTAFEKEMVGVASSPGILMNIAGVSRCWGNIGALSFSNLWKSQSCWAALSKLFRRLCWGCEIFALKAIRFSFTICCADGIYHTPSPNLLSWFLIRKQYQFIIDSFGQLQQDKDDLKSTFNPTTQSNRIIFFGCLLQTHTYIILQMRLLLSLC